MSRKIVWQKTTSSKFPTLAKSSNGGNIEEALKEAIGKITNWEAEIIKLMEKLTEEAVGCASDFDKEYFVGKRFTKHHDLKSFAEYAESYAECFGIVDTIERMVNSVVMGHKIEGYRAEGLH